MRKKLSSQEALTLFRELSSYEDATYIKWKSECQKNRSFYFGEQFTSEELADIEARGQFPYAINKVRKAIRGITGMMCATLPKFKFVPVGDTDGKKAAMCSILLDWVFKNSDDVQGYARVIKRASIDNIAYFHVINDKQGKIKYVPCTYEDVVVAKSSKDSLFRDASRIVLKKYITVEMAKAVYGIDNIQFDTPVYSGDQVTDRSMTVFLGKMFSADRRYVLVYETYRKLYVKRDDDYTVNIIKETLVGYNDLFTETLPDQITEYPIIPVYVEDTENPYKLGEVHFLKGLQKFINKAYGVALYNAQLLSNPKILVRETDIPNLDIAAFEDNFATPGAIGVLAGNASDPIIVMGQPLNSAFFTMYQDAVMAFEQATVPSDILGYQKGMGERSTSHLLDIKETVLDSFRDFTSNVEKALSQLAKVSLQFVQAYKSEESIIRILDSEKDYIELELNKKEGLDMTNPQSVGRYVNYLRQQQVSEDEIQAKLQKAEASTEVAQNISYIINDTKGLNFDIFVISGSYAPTYEMGMLRLMMELYEMQAVDNTAVLEHAPVGNKEELIERHSQSMRLVRENEELKASLEAIESTLQGREKELANLGISNVVEQARLKQERILSDTKLKAYLSKHRNKLLSKEMVDAIHDQVRDIVFKTQVSLAKQELNSKRIENPSPATVVDQVYR